MKQYKSISFGCTWRTKNNFNDKLQAILDEYAKKGWLLHSWQITASGSMCTVIFEKEVA